MGRTATGGAAVGDDDAVESEEAGQWSSRTAAIAAITTSRPATRIQRIRIRRVLLRTRLL
jgi:hypothetical protein